ncbi:MAG: SDR family NAD(P)-dependent oxidoreductase, partial [Burkholderiaceae bacterium]|nr:SDR family NAD(P)-dependent oxidoreductase [Burkholderiaceae bacterium]
MEARVHRTGELSGKVALVTGASSGLGARFAQVLADAGATVALGARRTDRLATLAAELTRGGARALAVELDVTQQGSIGAALAQIEREAGPVDILVNNAGIATESPILDTDEADWDRVLDTNLKGA